MGVPTMAQAKTFVGLDVHVSGIVAAVIDGASGELRRRRLSGGAVEVTEFVAGVPGPVRVTYAAGPAGFALAGGLEAAGVRRRRHARRGRSVRRDRRLRSLPPSRAAHELS